MGAPAERLADAFVLFVLRGCARVVRALPPVHVLALARLGGAALHLLDARGRRVGRQNLRAAYGDALTPPERRRLLRGSFQHVVRGLFVALHASPFTPGRVGRWIDVPPDLEARLRRLGATHRGGVLVSAHLGSWELLLGLPVLFPGAADIAFLVERTGLRAVDRFLEDVRTSGGLASVGRLGGARALARHVAKGGVAGMLADRNVRPTEGGAWAPFFGLAAATATLPARIARRTATPVLPAFCAPLPDGRYRLEVGEDLTAGLDPADGPAFDAAFARRYNAVLEARIRRQPEAWNWTFMRFKSRPHLALGPYPAYSGWRGPDPWADSPIARPRG